MGTNRTDEGINAKRVKDARLEIVANLYKRGYSFRKIAAEVKERLGLEKDVSLNTIHGDIKALKKELLETRISDMGFALNLELSRIDDTIRELWLQWEKSKQDYTKRSEKQKGSPRKVQPEPGSLIRPDGSSPEVIKTFQVEKTVQEVIKLGNVAYIAEIRMQLAERRKLIGLYAPERKELTGKDGKDLNQPAAAIDLTKLTDEEKVLLLSIARKNDQQD